MLEVERLETTDLFLHYAALVLVDGPALLLLPGLTLDLVHQGALLLALRLTEAHGGVGGGESPDQVTVVGPGGGEGGQGGERHQH